MEAMRKRVQQAFDDAEVIKVIFQYPAANRATIKTGRVLEVFDDGFTLDDVIDGEATYSYRFIVEIRGERESG